MVCRAASWGHPLKAQPLASCSGQRVLPCSTPRASRAAASSATGALRPQARTRMPKLGRSLRVPVLRVAATDDALTENYVEEDFYSILGVVRLTAASVPHCAGKTCLKGGAAVCRIGKSHWNALTP